MGLARTGNFTETAARLFLSQSAISHSIRSLEEELDCKLFERGPRKAVLTPAGEQFLHYAEKILRDMEEAREALGRREKWGKPKLRIGASIMACQYILPPVLREFKAAFPECQIVIEPGDTPQAMGWIEQSKIDLAIALEPQQAGAFDFHPLFEDELVFLCGPLHPWSSSKKAIHEELAGQNLILYSKASYTFQIVQEYFRREMVYLDSVIELGSMEAIKEMVKLGIGLGVLAPWVAQREIQVGVLTAVPLGKRRLKRKWGLFHRSGRRLSLVEETFLGLCRAATQSFRGMLNGVAA